MEHRTSRIEKLILGALALVFCATVSSVWVAVTAPHQAFAGWREVIVQELSEGRRADIRAVLDEFAQSQKGRN